MSGNILRIRKSLTNIWLILTFCSSIFILIVPILASSTYDDVELRYDPQVFSKSCTMSQSITENYNWTQELYFSVNPRIYDIQIYLPFSFQSLNKFNKKDGDGCYILNTSLWVNEMMYSHETFHHCAIGAGLGWVFPSRDKPLSSILHIGTNIIKVETDFWSEINLAGNDVSLFKAGPLMTIIKANHSIDGIAEPAKLFFFQGINAYFLQLITSGILLPVIYLIKKTTLFSKSEEIHKQ
ncbi:MAG: hypothetical protein ACFFFH_06820 [Candidatus Thorarchaeota archaeon]